MAYIALKSTEVAAGKPTTSSLLTKVKDNLIDHETRITSVETGATTVYPPIIMSVSGPYADFTTPQRTAVLKTTTNFALLITGARLIIDSPGSSGSTQVDILKKTGSGAWFSIFTTKPSVLSSSGADALSTDGVLDATRVNIAAGDLIRLDLTSVQGGVPNGFFVRLDYNKV